VLTSLRRGGRVDGGCQQEGCEQGCAWEEREAQLGTIRVESFTTLLLLGRVVVVLVWFAFFCDGQVLGRGGEYMLNVVFQRRVLILDQS
jgi:hypothetical protein